MQDMTTSKDASSNGRLLGVGLDPVELEPGGVRAAAARVQQFGCQIARGHLRPGAGGGQRGIAGAGGDVEHAYVGPMPAAATSLGPSGSRNVSTMAG